jgi:hypothetical protein
LVQKRFQNSTGILCKIGQVDELLQSVWQQSLGGTFANERSKFWFNTVLVARAIAFVNQLEEVLCEVAAQ